MLKRVLFLMTLLLPLLIAFQADARSSGFMFNVYTGKATYYSANLHGNKTASGERYDKKALTAAHRSLPMGTVIRVTNLANGQNQLLRINDRGPFKKSLLVDISQEAARRLNMIKRGVAPVQVEVVSDSKGLPIQPGTSFYIKLGDARSVTDAQAKLSSMETSQKSSQKVASKNNSHKKVKKKKIRHQQRANAQIFAAAGLHGKKKYFVGQGPYSRYADALRAQQRLADRNDDITIVCLPAVLPANEWTAAR